MLLSTECTKSWYYTHHDYTQKYVCVSCTSSPCLRTLRVDRGPRPQATYNCGVSSLAKSAICQKQKETYEPTRKCNVHYCSEVVRYLGGPVIQTSAGKYTQTDRERSCYTPPLWSCFQCRCLSHDRKTGNLCSPSKFLPLSM